MNKIDNYIKINTKIRSNKYFIEGLSLQCLIWDNA